MKESISYTFILNIVITFVFICFAVIMGIFSYNRAFRAGVIITDAIEKYEGFNCLSEEEINKKLRTISYNVPFEADCSKADEDDQCRVDTNRNYAVVSYNLDDKGTEKLDSSNGLTTKYIDEDEMNSVYICDGNSACTNTKKYQYGVFTYMYVDLPVVSSLLKLSVFSKTNVMYEFRDINLAGLNGNPYDGRLIPEYITEENKKNKFKHADLFYLALTNEMLNRAAGSGVGLDVTDLEYSARLAFQHDPSGNFPKILANDVSTVKNGYSQEHACGYTYDYSKY